MPSRAVLAVVATAAVSALAVAPVSAGVGLLCTDRTPGLEPTVEPFDQPHAAVYNDGLLVWWEPAGFRDPSFTLFDARAPTGPVVFFQGYVARPGDPDSPVRFMDAALDGDRLYVAQDEPPALVTLDVSDPSAPVALFETPIEYIIGDPEPRRIAAAADFFALAAGFGCDASTP